MRRSGCAAVKAIMNEATTVTAKLISSNTNARGSERKLALQKSLIRCISLRGCVVCSSSPRWWPAANLQTSSSENGWVFGVQKSSSDWFLWSLAHWRSGPMCAVVVLHFFLVRSRCKGALWPGNCLWSFNVMWHHRAFAVVFSFLFSWWVFYLIFLFVPTHFYEISKKRMFEWDGIS